MDEQQERAVEQGLREGRAEAWRSLYDAYAERVWRAVARLLGPRSADVADVVQETFMAAARSAHTYDANRGPLWFWLWGIGRRHVALHYRKQEQRHRLKQAVYWLSAGDRRVLGWVTGREERPPAALETDELALLVRGTLTELSADYEILLTARYLDDVSVEEIACREQSTITAIRSKLARARQAFRQAFAKHSSALTDSELRAYHEPTGQ